ncbi:transmembrane protein, putative (macronuclear) [Tetrahymena thermophila SB210]|uniref:Transmembrane protein, putative n=1 Tax=Tetrahymena thermophila (strain SB210) TaxID=312017 RepID=I7MJ75_TETTS|nr:transmembrane protein, putative [Tetrahymena thermophila SB210]EAS05960.2 transmembrane protein, putative [Tetrahymena thermophila SB210]|eukprot:XP_001026205.2 transmembrane protein, putative [Tetrahymena thermophila SB210]
MKKYQLQIAIASLCLITYTYCEQINILLQNNQVGQVNNYNIQLSSFQDWNSTYQNSFPLSIQFYFPQEFQNAISNLNIIQNQQTLQYFSSVSGKSYLVEFSIVINSGNCQIWFNNFLNPSYSGTYIIPISIYDKYQNRQYQNQIQIQQINSNNNIQLYFNNGQQTNIQGTLNLNIQPSILLPSDLGISIKLPQYSASKPSMNYVNNPVTCILKQQQGNINLPCVLNAQNLLNITNILTTSQTTITPLTIQIANVLAPISTQPVVGFNVSLYGQTNGGLIQYENNKSVNASSASNPNSITISSSNQNTLNTTSLVVNIKAQTFFSPSYVIIFKLPIDFVVSNFQSQLKGYTQDGRQITLSIQKDQSILIQSDISVAGDDSKFYFRLDGVQNYQGAYQTSTYFQTIVYSDNTLQYIVCQDLNSIQYQTLSSQLVINKFSFLPQQVQIVSSYIFQFSMMNSLDATSMISNRITINLPSQVSYTTNMVSSMLGNGIVSCNNYINFIQFANISASATCEMPSDSVIRIYNFFIQNNNNLAINLKQVVNPYSTAQTQNFVIQVEIQKSTNPNWLTVYQNSQNDGTTSIVASSGQISLLKFQGVNNQITFNQNNYLISFSTTSQLIPNSFIDIQFPLDDFLFKQISQSSFSCQFISGQFSSQNSCSLNIGNIVEINLQSSQSIPSGSVITLMINGIINPRSTRPTGQLNITTLSPTRNIIDTIQTSSSIGSLSMSIPNTLQIFSVQPQSFLIGDKTMYTFTLQSPVQILSGDVLTINVLELLPQNQQSMICSGIQGLPITLSCSQSGTNITLTMQSPIAPNTVIQFTVSNLQNPYSNVISAPLLFCIYDSQGYIIATSQFSDVAKRGSQIGYDSVIFQQTSVTPDSYKVGQITTYRLNFNLPIPINQSQSIIIYLPSDIGINNSNISCYLLFKNLSQNTNTICSYQQANHSILITKFLPISNRRLLSSGQQYIQKEYSDIQSMNFQQEQRYLSSISTIPINTNLIISLTGIQNKLNNGPFQSNTSSQFKVSISNIDSSGKIVELASSIISLAPSYTCSSPCINCQGIDTQCTSCQGSQILLPELSQCEANCPNNYVRVQSQKYQQQVCLRCLSFESDINCSSCDPYNLNVCTQCVNRYKLIYDQNGTARCEEISSDNDPLRDFVYNIEYNLPYISLYILIVSIYCIVRKIFKVKNLILVAVLLSCYSLIEIIVLIAFIVKICLLQQFLPILLAGLLILVYVVSQYFFAYRFKKSLFKDQGYNLYEPNYKTVRVVQKLALIFNFKIFLMYRSNFSHIKDIFYIPFSNSQLLLHTIKKGLQICLLLGIAILAFDGWVMYYTYNYRNVIIPPFFFIEFAFFHFLIVIMLLLLLIPNKKYSLDIIFDSVNENDIKYKSKQLDLKNISSTLIQTKTIQAVDHQNQFQTHSIYMTAKNPTYSSSDIQHISVTRNNIPRSTTVIHLDNNAKKYGNQQDQSLIQNEQKSNQMIPPINNNRDKKQLPGMGKQIMNKQESQSFLILNNGLQQNLSNSTPNNQSMNHELFPSNFNSSSELQIQERFQSQAQRSPININNHSNSSNIQIQQSESEDEKKLKKINNNYNNQESDQTKSHKSKTIHNIDSNLNRDNYHQQMILNNQKLSSDDRSPQSHSPEQVNTGNFEKQSTSVQSQRHQELKTPDKLTKSSSKSLSPKDLSNQKLTQKEKNLEVQARTIFSPTQLLLNNLEEQKNGMKKSQDIKQQKQFQQIQSSKAQLDEADIEVDIQDSNIRNLKNQMYASKQHQNNFYNKKQQNRVSQQIQSSQDQTQNNLTEKYTESSQEVEENHCLNAQLQSLTKHNNLSQQNNQFISPRVNILQANDITNSYSTPQIGQQMSNQTSQMQEHANQELQEQQLSNFSKFQDNNQSNNNMNNQSENSPINLKKNQAFDLNKNQPPSFSQNLNISNGKQNNYQQLYSFNNNRQAKIPSTQYVSSFDKFQMDNNQQQLLSQNNQQPVNTIQETRNIPIQIQTNQSTPTDQKKNSKIFGNLLHDMLQNPISSVIQSTDSKTSQYFPQENISNY